MQVLPTSKGVRDGCALDTAEIARRRSIAQANVTALAQRGIDLRSAFAEWSPTGVNDSLRANVAMPPMGTTASTAPKPIVLEGIDAPGVLRTLYNSTRALPDGYAPRILVVQRDPLEFLEGLSREDLTDVFADNRLWIAIGEDAAERLRHELRTRLDISLPGQVITCPGTKSRLVPSIAQVAEALLAEQQSLHTALRSRAEQHYAAMNRSRWAERYADTTRPLRILIPTTRYSTFVRHSAEDLAEALKLLGHHAQVLIEPDNHSKLASTAYLRSLAEWTPDLVILINYTRSQMSGALVQGVPLVCWIQDAMPHLFAKQTGTAQGPLDFLAGYLPAELFDSFGYTRSRAMNSPLTASARKFHSTPADKALLREHACEIAYVSHQSERPEAFVERMLAAAPAGTPARRAVERAAPLVLGAVNDAMRVVVRDAVREAARSSLREAAGADVPPEVVSTFVNQFCAPLAERAFRHQALDWAAEITQRRGWRLRVYGRGWDKHPRLSPFACGELPHGEALRASYQAACVHVHVSTYSVVHQRVMECALSGGLPCCRLQKREVDSVVQRMMDETARTSDPARLTELYAHYTTADSPLLIRRARMEQRLGIPARPEYAIKRTFVEQMRRQPMAEYLFLADELLGDLPETTFWDAASLEALVARSLEMPTWRAQTVGAIAARVRSHMTTDVFADRLIKFVGASMSD